MGCLVEYYIHQADYHLTIFTVVGSLTEGARRYLVFVTKGDQDAFKVHDPLLSLCNLQWMRERATTYNLL